MIAEISAGFSSLKAAKDIVQALDGIKTAVAINEVKVTLQQHILDAQESLSAARDAQSESAQLIAQLEQEVMRLNDWTSEREHYDLVQIAGGSFAYMLKPDMRDKQPPHWLCTHCFGSGKKSILQNQNLGFGRSTETICPACKMSILLPKDSYPLYLE